LLLEVFVKRFFSVFLLLSGLFLPSGANAVYTVYLYESGDSVLASGSGTINLTGLTQVNLGPIPFVRLADPRNSVLNIGGGGNVDTYRTTSGPSNFGGGGLINATSGTGDSVGIDILQVPQVIAVPGGYVSGSPLTSQSIFQGRTLAGMGATIGPPYTYTWGAGGNADSFILIVGSAPPPPIPAAQAVASLSEWSRLMLGLMVISMLGWHFYRERSY